jgi:hypothetical protein
LRKPDIVSKPAPRWLLPALLALTGVLLLGLFSTEISDPDFWWHLKTGQYIVTGHRLPVPDPFAFTTASAAPVSPDEAATRRFNLTHEWLSQAVWYLIYSAGGFGAVVLWKALLLTILCASTGWIAWRRTGSALWGMAAALAAGALAIEFDRDRPGILSYVFTAAFVAIFESRRRLWPLPVLAAIWANCHGGFFLGWIVCGAYAAESLLRRAPDRRRVLLVSGLAIVLSGLNPNGYAALETVLRYRRSPLQSTLIEWAHADLWGPPYAFDLLLYGAALSLLLSWKRVRPADWILFAAFAAASITAFRNEMLIGLLAPVLIAAYFPWKRALPAPWKRRLAAQAPFAAAVLLAAGFVWGCVRGDFFQLRVAEWRYPAGAARFLAEHPIAAPLFNTYEYGGYLIWRGQRVFIDGRALSESVFQDYRTILAAPPNDPARAALLTKYGIGVIVANAFEYNAGMMYPLVLALSDWKLVYEDPQALVFVRDLPPGMPALDAGRLCDHLDAECRLHVEHDPGLPGCARTLGDYFLRSGDRARARRALELYLQHPYPGDTGARRAYMQLMQ